MKRARVAAGLSQEELARKLDVSVMTVSRLERGVAKTLDVFALIRVAEAVDVPVAALLGETS